MGLKIENLSKSYGNFKALNNVSFEVGNGQILGILGRNGAGKTTTIKSIMGIIEQDEGSITFDGKDIKKSNVSIGYLPEERGLYVNAKVKDQLLYFAMLNGYKKKEALCEAEKLMKEFKISNYMNKKVKSLSKGNKQKIQLITAILHKPDVVILDEPFSGLDPVNIELFKDTVFRLKERGTTILFSSHRMEDVEEMCDKIVMLNKGTVIENCTVNELIDKHSRADEIEINAEGDISILIENNGLQLINRDDNVFIVKYKNKKQLQNLYRDMIDNSIEINEIINQKISLQNIFIKELADNDK